jgi:hypothetical protein
MNDYLILTLNATCPGGGTFISKTGQTGATFDLAALSKNDGAAFELPDDCLPSEKNLDRHYEAITINHSTSLITI